MPKSIKKDTAPRPDALESGSDGGSAQTFQPPQQKAVKPKAATTSAMPTPTLESGSDPKSKAKAKTKASVQKSDAPFSLLTEMDIYLFREGRHFKLYEKLGSHVVTHNGTKGTYFAVWAPNAQYVSVVGDFNEWDRGTHAMQARDQDDSGIWELFIPHLGQGTLYKYHVASRFDGYNADKADPFAFSCEVPPKTASVVWDLKSEWSDGDWTRQRDARGDAAQPMSVYEMHIGSWKRNLEDNFRSLSYRELADQLPAYLKDLGYTHVEFMPVMEHPFFGSWGYQVTGFYAPSSRYGTPQDFMHLVNALHQAGVGVILDWVPSHFPNDLHGLSYFDGTHLFEHADERKGYHPDWKSAIFNYGRNEVKAFLISNALFWLEQYHADALRVDAVASMLYLDYSRKEGEWIPNEFGGRENLEAIQFLKEFNIAVYENHPGVVTIAEESTAWPMVSRPTYMGGLGFGMKWMMGWMHDTLKYFSEEPVNRRYHQGMITFSTVYAFTENFMLPLSHDEVVYGKHALIYKMPGDEWQKFANLRLLFGYMYAHPGQKLLFMGGEFGQTREWNHDGSLDWHLLDHGPHQGALNFTRAVNHVYTREPALYEVPFDGEGFEWVDIADHENSVISFVRKSKEAAEVVLVVCNFTPVPREHYRIGSHAEGTWTEILNSDDPAYGGSGVVNSQPLSTEPLPKHGRQHSLTVTLPPLGVTYLKFKGA